MFSPTTMAACSRGQALIEHGHRRIAFADFWTGRPRERYNGYVARIARPGSR